MRRSLQHAVILLSIIDAWALSQISQFLRPRLFSTKLYVDGGRVEVDDSTKSTSQGDFFSEVIVQPKRNTNRKRKRRTPAAPVVDSTLLRFLSSQKKDPNSTISTNSLIDEDKDNVNVDTDTDTNPKVNTKDKDQSRTNVYADPLKHIEAADENDSLWLGPFQSHKISQRLLQLGVDQNLANQAGLSVENHVKARIARRRVRQFLKQRDIMWLSGRHQNDTTALLEGSVQIRSKLIQPAELHYYLDDNIQLMDNFGLTPTDVATTLIHTPSVATMMTKASDDNLQGETLERTLTRAFRSLLCTSLALRRYDARKVLRKTPGLLTLRGSKRAEEVVALMSSLGLSNTAISRDRIGLPILLARNPVAIFRLVSFLASDAVRMPVSSIGPLFRRKISWELLNAVAPVASTDRFNPASQNLDTKSIIISSADVREQTNEIYKNMTTTALMIKNEIGAADLAKVVAAYPSVLLLDAQQILRVANFLMNDLGIYEQNLLSVLQLYPTLLGRPIESMQERVEYIKSLGIDDETLTSVFRAFPVLLTTSIEKKMKPVVHFLQEIGVRNVGRFITFIPPILRYSVEYDLKPKWDFLQKVCLYPCFEVSAFPNYYSYPLERIIKTRYEYLIAVKKIPTQLLALDLVLRYDDKEFACLVAKDEDEGAAYARFAKLRNKMRLEKTTEKVGRKIQRQKRSSPIRAVNTTNDEEEES